MEPLVYLAPQKKIRNLWSGEIRVGIINLDQKLRGNKDLDYAKTII